MIHKFSTDELREYNQLQIQEILKYKWIESEKAGHDIGELCAACEWIKNFGNDFRESFKKSKTPVSGGV